MTEHRCPTTAQVQAMIDAGGGGSQEIDIGQSTGAKATTIQVNFGFTFSAIPRVVLTPWSAHIVNLISVSTTMFEWINDSKNVDVTVDWIAVNT